MSKPSTPWIARFLEKGGEMLYLVVEQVNDEDVDGTLLRFRVHRHPQGSPRVAGASNEIIWEESGNQHHLRLAFIKYLLDRRDEGWRRTGATDFGSTPAHQFWSLKDL